MISETSLDTIFRNARSHNAWTDRPVTETQLRQIYELMKWGSTSANCSPARLLFLRTEAAKRRLRPHLAAGNVEKTMTAPVTVIVGFDLEFYRQLPKLFPHSPAMQEGFMGPDQREHAITTAFRNGTLQGGYFMLAARSLGLDCGPMSGFDSPAVDKEFWPGTAVRTNFLCNLGYGDGSKLFPRHPRLEFEEACRLL